MYTAPTGSWHGYSVVITTTVPDIYCQMALQFRMYIYMYMYDLSIALLGLVDCSVGFVVLQVLGTDLTAAGRRVAVISVDPSSVRTGGSILGDKTRMHKLSRDPRCDGRPPKA